MENNHLNYEWLKIVKEIKESNVTQEEFKAFIESKKREKVDVEFWGRCEKMEVRIPPIEMETLNVSVFYLKRNSTN